MGDISKDKKKEIEEKVKNILSEKADLEESSIVNIVRLVKKDGFRVIIQDMDIETTGILLVNDESKKKRQRERTIIVNSTFNNQNNDNNFVYKKSRFITAHEYGHFILHREPGQPIYAHRDTCHKEEDKELEADYFARSILLPLKQFRSFYQAASEIGDGDNDFVVNLLSDFFGVTKKKISLRIGDLAELDS